MKLKVTIYNADPFCLSGWLCCPYVRKELAMAVDGTCTHVESTVSTSD